MTISAEEIAKAKAAYEALPPIERAIHDLEQRRSGARGLASFDSDIKAVNAAIDARPEYVILAAYREAVASLTDMKAEIEKLSKESKGHYDRSCLIYSNLGEERETNKGLRARIAELEAQSSAQRGPEIEIDYTNYRGERAVRRIQPITIFFGASKWHPELQWLLKAFDCEKVAERCFALRDIHAWDSAQPSAQFVAGMRRAAEIVKDNCETFSTTGGDERKALSPRRSGDLAGLSYAAAILAEAALKGGGGG